MTVLTELCHVSPFVLLKLLLHIIFIGELLDCVEKNIKESIVRIFYNMVLLP